MRFRLAAAALCAILFAAVAHAAFPIHFGSFASGSAPTIRITSVTPTSASYMPPAAPGATLATMVAAVSSGSFTGSYSLNAGDAGCADLLVNAVTGVLTVGASPLTTSVTCTVFATQGSAVNSPFMQLVTITATPPTIESVAPTTVAYTSPASPGSALATMTATLSFGSFTGTWSLSADAGCSDLVVNAGTGALTVGAGPLSGSPTCHVVATQAGATASPFSQLVTITGTAQSIASASLSNNSFFAGSSGGTIVGSAAAVMSPSSPPFAGTWSVTGTDAADFTFVGSNLETVGTLCGSPPCTYNINIVATQAGATGSPLSQAEVITAVAAGGVVGTVDFFNNNATTVAGPIPVQSGIYFGPGVVPSGQSVIPSVGGVPLTQWECTSEALNWPDGSFRGCSFSGFLPNSITAGSREQVTWTLTSGSMPSIVAANPSEVTGASNFHQDFTNTSGASQSTNVPYGLTVGVVIGSGGTLIGTAVHQQTILGNSCGSGANCGGLTVSITGCSVAPTVSFTSTGGSPNLPLSAAVASAGSGCPVTGSGAWSFQVNSILAAAGSSVPLCTSQTANTQVCQYSGSAVKDGFRVWGYYVDTGKPAWAASTVYASNSTVLSKGNAFTNASGCTSGSTAPTGITASVSDGGCTWSTVIGWEQGVADVEYWKTSGGSLYGFNVSTESDDGIYQAGETIPPHSFSSDLYDGSLDLRGAANDTGFVGINQFGNGGAWYTVDTEGLPIWDIGNSTANSPALNKVVVSLTTADKVYFHKNHAVPPLQQVTLTSNVVLPRNSAVRSLANMLFDFSIYVPLCWCDVDEQAGIGNGGSHAWDSVMTEANAAWYEVTDSASDGGWSWLGDSRLGALAAAGGWGGPSEPLTHHAVNWIPSIGWTPPTNFTDPVRPNAYLATGFTGFDMNVTQQSWPAPDSEHFGNWARFMFVVEGRRYMLDALDLAFRQVQMQETPSTDRIATFGGTTYYSEMNSYVPRTNSWYLYNTAMAAIFLNQEPDGQYAYKQWHDGYTEMAAYVSFVGSGTYSVNATAFQKCTDWTPIGMLMLPSALEGANCSNVPGFAPGGSSWFMFGYVLFDLENDKMLNDGAIAGIDATNAAFTGAMVQNADQCPYLTPPYTYPLLTNPYTQTLISTTDGTTVASTSRPSQPGGRLSNMLAWTAGNSTFTASVTPTAGDENWFAKPTAALSGTTLALDTAVGVAGSQVYDMSVPADVGVNTFVNGGSPPSASVTVNQAVSVPAPVTTAINSITSSSVLVVAPPGAGSIEVGDTVVDVTHPSAIDSSYTDFAENVTVSAISGSGPFTVTLMYNGSLCGGECAPTNGDTVKFAHMLGFSSRYDYPDTGLLPASAGTPLPNGSFICLTDYTQGDEVSPGDRTVGTYPPTTSAGGTLTEGQCFVATEVGTSGTAWTLTTLSTATPPNTVVVPSSTGQGPGGYIPNAACPAATFGELQQGSADYQNPSARMAEQYGFTNLAAALGINSTAAAGAITLMAPYQTPLGSVYGPAAGSQYFLLDNHF